MIHTVLYRSAQAAGATFASLSAVPFSQDVVSNNKILPQRPCELLFATGNGANLSAARIQTPLLIQTGSNHLRPFVVGAAFGSNPNTANFWRSPVKFRATENIDVQTSNAGGAPETHTFVLQLGDGNYSMPAGQRLKIRAQSATTVTAGAWTLCPLTFDDNLPNKQFAILGFEVFSATGIVGRLDIPGMAWKPGFPCITSLANRMNDLQYDTPLGELGRFSNQALPNLEIFCTAADTAAEVFMDVVVLN